MTILGVSLRGRKQRSNLYLYHAEQQDTQIIAILNFIDIQYFVYLMTNKYNTEAISREKQIKGGSREKKIELIDGSNEEWKDLYEDICG